MSPYGQSIMRDRLALLAGIAALVTAGCQSTPQASDPPDLVYDQALVDQARPSGAARAGERVDRFVVDQVILRPRSVQDLRRFVAAYGGTVIDDGLLEAHDGRAPAQRQPAHPAEDPFVLVRVDLERADLWKLDEWLKMSFDQEIVFSSQWSARLLAIVVEAATNGFEVTPNWLMAWTDADCVISKTREHPQGAASRDGFAFDWASDPAFGVTAAWQYWDLLDVPAGNVNLAIIDTGFASNPDFPPVGRLIQYDRVDGDANVFLPPSVLPEPQMWHGLRAASVAAARLDNRFGSVGTGAVAEPTLAFIRAAQGRPTTYDATQAILLAVQFGADVISMSMAGDRGPLYAALQRSFSIISPLQLAVWRAISDGVIVVAAAGNGETDLDAAMQVPCELDGVICVGAIDTSSKQALRGAAGSNYGSNVDIWAPGLGIDTTPTPGSNELSRADGTSAATPYVAGVLSLMRSVDPALDNDEALTILQQTAGTSADPRVQRGFVNAYDALVMTGGAVGRAPAGDRHEPNNEAATATPLRGSGAAATIGPGDEDFYIVQVNDLAAVFQATVDAMTVDGRDALQVDVLTMDGDPADLRGTLNPGRYLVRIKGATPQTMSCYELKCVYQPAMLEPDQFDDQTPAGEVPNDDREHATVIKLIESPDDPRFVMLAGPDSLQLGGKGMAADAAPLVFHDERDVDVFRIELDPNFAFTFKTECPRVLAPSLPAGYEPIDRQDAAVLTLRATPITAADSQTGTSLHGKRFPLTFTVYDSSGRPISDPAITHQPWGVDIVCPDTLFPDGVVYLKIDPDGQRSFYRFEATYREPFVIARNVESISAGRPFFTFDLDRSIWIPPFDPEPLHLVYPSDPALLGRSMANHDGPSPPPEYVRFEWPETGDLSLDLVATFPGAQAQLTLVDSAGQVLASSRPVDTGDGLTRRRITMPQLPAGWYALQVDFFQGGQPYTLQSSP
jgi:subtilisin family serine protease